MHRFVLPASAALAALAPGAAAAKPPSAAHVREYERAYHQVVQRLGRRAPGRNIIKDGLAPGRAVWPAADGARARPG